MKKALLLFGGESTEHDVSIMSARNVIDNIDRRKFRVTLGYISKTGRWSVVDGVDDLEGGRETAPVLGEAKFVFTDTGDSYAPDVIFPILHGRGGEDGLVQALAELLHIPIVGCGAESSAICMDKVATKQILQAVGINTVPYRVARKYETPPTFAEISAELGSELFIKPPRQGSSVGVSKAGNQDEFSAALDQAFKYDDVVLIEKAINGRELETAVLGNPPNIEVSHVGEIVAGADFYDYNAKYAANSASQTTIPADIDDQIADEIRKIARDTFAALGCSGLARVDFFLDGEEIYVNEINTIPGFTNISMYPKLWLNAGLSYPDLIEKMVNLALEKS
jgi:D-alanine-D-alanine ligase